MSKALHNPQLKTLPKSYQNQTHQEEYQQILRKYRAILVMRVICTRGILLSLCYADYQILHDVLIIDDSQDMVRNIDYGEHPKVIFGKDLSHVFPQVIFFDTHRRRGHDLPQTHFILGHDQFPQICHAHKNIILVYHKNIRYLVRLVS